MNGFLEAARAIARAVIFILRGVLVGVICALVIGNPIGLLGGAIVMVNELTERD